MSSHQYRRYDPRLRNLVAEAGDVSRFHRYGIPKSTLRQWIKNGYQEFFTIPELSLSGTELVKENLELKFKLAAITAEQDLVSKTLKIFGFEIQYKRLPSSSAKGEIITAIRKASESISLQTCLVAIGLTAARYHHWIKREVTCLLEDRSSCPRVSPTQLMQTEVNKIRELFLSKDFAHYSTTALSWLAKKTGDVVASPSTWSRVIRQLGLKRNVVRIYPAKPKVGIRASAPGQIWHLDLTILRLEDGTRAFVQCIIDNFSRYVLAWKVSQDYGGLRTKELLEIAIVKAQSLGLLLTPEVFVDSGTENLNEHVDQIVSSNLISRTIAQIDIEASNSMIESLFHRLKHRYLFTIPLTNIDALTSGVDFYLTESNTRMPHSALKGATPEEMISGRWNQDKILEMKEKIMAARTIRSHLNKNRRCLPCLV